VYVSAKIDRQNETDSVQRWQTNKTSDQHEEVDTAQTDMIQAKLHEQETRDKRQEERNQG
jgi:hypothetical protein